MKKAMIEQLVLGMVGTNTWLIKNKENNELLIIDPADESARIEEKIDRMGGIPVAVLLTHGHFDHMLAADDLRDEYGIPIIACAAEQQVLTDSIKNLSGILGDPNRRDRCRHFLNQCQPLFTVLFIAPVDQFFQCRTPESS